MTTAMTTAMDRLCHRWLARTRATMTSDAPVWIPDWRSTGNGHRIGPEPPGQTRELPAVLWPFELAGRAEAVIRGHLIRKGRLPR